MKIGKNKVTVAALAGTLALGLAVGSWAYFSQALSVENEFQTGKYDTKIVEEFTPPDDWVPGVEIEKAVKVMNIGEVPVVVRASFAELWNKLDDNGDIAKDEDGDPVTLPENIIEIDEDGNETDTGEDAVFKNFSANVVELGTTDIAAAIANNPGKWLHVGDANDPLDGYYYYIGVVEPDKKLPGQTSNQTPLLLEGVTMNPKLNNTVISVTETVYKDSSGTTKVTKTEEKSVYGYDNAKYTMTITAETVQATEGAILEKFGNSAFAAAFAQAFGGWTEPDIEE